MNQRHKRFYVYNVTGDDDPAIAPYRMNEYDLVSIHKADNILKELQNVEDFKDTLIVAIEGCFHLKDGILTFIQSLQQFEESTQFKKKYSLKNLSKDKHDSLAPLRDYLSQKYLSPSKVKDVLGQWMFVSVINSEYFFEHIPSKTYATFNEFGEIMVDESLTLRQA